MPIGPTVRRLLGPFEKTAADAYRRFFFEIDDLARYLAESAPARRILEIGCGEGALIERLARRLPEAELTGIDVTPRVGRLASDVGGRVRFLQATAGEAAASAPATYDLVILCDVLHHVPEPSRDDLLRDALGSLAPGGRLLLKDWERRFSPIHAIAYFSDRVITGDRIRYETADQWRSRLRRTVGGETAIAERRFRPWRNNLAFLVGPI